MPEAILGGAKSAGPPPPITPGFSRRDTVHERHVYIELDYDQLATLLGLPDGLRVYAVVPPDITGRVKIGIEGEQLARISSTGEPHRVSPSIEPYVLPEDDQEKIFIRVVWDEVLKPHLESVR